MTYHWNGDLLFDVMALPAAVADRSLRLAGAAQLKVLLWFARHGGEFDTADCADALGLPAADCADALRYWVDTGVICADGTAPVAAPAPTPEPTPEPAPVVREKRPQLPEVLKAQAANADFDYLLKSAEQRLGRALTPGEMETFYYLYGTLKLPAEVILMLLVHLIDRGKVKSKSGFKNYLEKVALSWVDEGIVTIAAAEQALCRAERRDAVREHMTALFSLPTAPSAKAVEQAMRWMDEWGFSDEVLRLVYDQYHDKKSPFSYINRVLESWHADGITTVEQAKAALTPAKKGASPLPSEEVAPAQSLDEYERAVTAWRPVYKKEGTP